MISLLRLVTCPTWRFRAQGCLPHLVPCSVCPCGSAMAHMIMRRINWRALFRAYPNVGGLKCSKWWVHLAPELVRGIRQRANVFSAPPNESKALAQFDTPAQVRVELHVCNLMARDKSECSGIARRIFISRTFQ